MAINWQKLASYLPEVSRPLKKKLGFNEKLKWTGVTLVLYFILLHIPLYGLGQNSLDQFEQLSTILGASFGSVISLGIGPIVTASIVLQLLVGSGILGMDLTKPDDRSKFQAMQRIVTIAFIALEACIYVLMGGLAPNPSLLGTSAYATFQAILIAQLFIGGYLIVFMDELVQKWGFGSGIGLFIAAGVSRQIFIAALSPFSPITSSAPSGRIPEMLIALQSSNVVGALIPAVAILATIIVFMMAVYGQAMKVEIPLSFGRVRGYGIRWPLKFIYTSNIPVILIAALMANIQLWARLLENWGHPILGTFSGGTPVSGIVKWVNSPNIVNSLVAGSVTGELVMQAVIYTAIMVIGAVFFSMMWVKTSNMGADAQAKQILASGLQIPGFRRDPRVLESILNRYIPALTVMGGATVGFLAAFADLSGALSRGTGILLTVMILYKLYEDIAKQHAYDMHPALRKFISPEGSS
jgi:preprotein translocase subunit SecY